MEILLSDSDCQRIAEMTAKRLADLIQPKAAQERVQILGIRGLAKHLNCSPSHAQALKNEKKVPFYNHGNRVFFYSDEVDKSLKK